MTLWPDYLVERARLRPPVGCLNAIVKGSTPVVSFGNPVRASVATLALNPSYEEFRNDRGLATLEALGILGYDEIDDRLGAKIVDKCAGYFDRRPYKWFLALNHILSAGALASYYPGTACPNTACHLDLSPWATSPTWRRLQDDIRDKLLEDGEEFLCKILHNERYRLVIADGSTPDKCGPKEWIERAGFTSWTRIGKIKGDPAIDLYVGEGGVTRFLAWSCYINTHIKKQPEHIPALIRFVAQYSGGRRVY